MVFAKRNGKKRSNIGIAVPQTTYVDDDGYVTTLSPEGSFNNVKVFENKRIIKRPEINYLDFAIQIIVPVILFAGALCFGFHIAVLLLFAYVVIRAGFITIWFVRLYQRYASEELRLSCVFEPCCSDYMILSIQKHGVVRGIVKGIKRLRRCHHPNGGEDYP